MITFYLINGNNNDLEFVSRLNQEYGHKHCSFHPKEKTIVGLDYSTGSMKVFVSESCCNDFTEKVKKLETDIRHLSE